jgi:hypothetical protein
MERFALRGKLTVERRGPEGVPSLVRRARNTVVRSGAGLVGALMSGRAATPINGMAVGTNAQPLAPPYELTRLTTVTETGAPIVEHTAALTPDAFTVEDLPSEQLTRITVRGVIPRQGALPAGTDPGRSALIGEAALGVLDVAGTALATLYNRVVFEPIPKGPAHELVLYWEITLPYGV